MTAAADLVVLGDVWTGDTARTWTHGVAVQHGRIVALGTEMELREHVGPATRVIHAKGKPIVPGFQDAHVHAPFAGRDRRRVWLHDLAGKDAYLDEIARYEVAHPERDWILGSGWAMEHFPGGTPDRADLDAVVPDRPVFLFNRDVHGAWVNSEALRIAGIDESTPDPADGRYERDADGRITGTLHEGAAYAFAARFVPEPDAVEWQAAILDAQAHLHSLGITGWQDAWVTPETQDAYVTLAQSGRLTARVVGALWWDRHRGLEQIPELVARRERAAPGFSPTSVKIMVDGVLENRTGALLAPYLDSCGHATEETGLQYVDADLLAAAVTELDRLGFQVHQHTIGDRAVRLGLDAVAAARRANGPTDHRHHLAHLQVVHPEDLPRFRELAVVANCQAYWAQPEPQLTELTIPFLGTERAGWMYPFGALQRSGARLALGSDWPVTTADPLPQLEVAVTRLDPTDRDGEPFLPHERLALPDALAAFTMGSAFGNHDESEAGSIEVGKRADLVVLDRNVFAVPGHIADARVELTVANGIVVHDLLC